MKYVYYIFATLCISLCIYSIKAGNTYGIILMAIWGVYHLIKAICTTVEDRNKRKNLDQEAKEIFDELTKRDKMKSILIAIQPYWVFLIIAKIMGWEIDQEKTVEVRKTFPKDLNWNKKSIIYCSKNKQSFNRIPKKYQPLMEKFLGKVIGEFVCDRIDDFYCASIPYRKENNLGYGYFIDDGVYKVDGWHEGVVFERSGPRIDTMLKNTDLENMCLSAQELFDYIGIGKHLYGWHITDLVIYDEPKELGEFEFPKDSYFDSYRERTKILKGITRPPQSWCYVEELGV